MAERAFVAEGAKLVEEALAQDAPVESVYWAPGAPPGLVARAHEAGVRVFELAPGTLERVADTVTPQPLMAVVGMVDVPLDRLAQASLVVVCDQVRDPGNAGTVLRGARAAGADGVVCCDGSVDVYNPKTVRASAGAVFGVPIVSGGDVGLVMDRMGRWGLRRLGAVSAGGQDYASVDLTRRIALLVGNESRGLGGDAVALTDEQVTIPMAPAAESLNVGVATAVLCFEAARQRRLSPAVAPA
jgi:TrmH family RNA methyltransferase